MRQFLCGLFLLVLSLPSVNAEDVNAILSRMDASAPTLRSMSADIKMVTVTAIIDDRLTETGTLKMQKKKSDSVRAVIDFSALKDGARVIGFFGKIVRIYYPKADYYQDYEVGKNSNVLNQFLLLGFGSSGHDLAAGYTIAADGTEKLAGIETTKLLLTPKDSKVAEHLSKIEIWIPKGESNPIQQQFFEPSGNYRIVTYSNLHLNPAMPQDLDIKMQKGTQKHSS